VKRFDKLIAEIKWCSFFAPHVDPPCSDSTRRLCLLMVTLLESSRHAISRLQADCRPPKMNIASFAVLDSMFDHIISIYSKVTCARPLKTASGQ